MEFNATKCPRTISNWNIVFQERNKFLHPNPHIANGIRQKPIILQPALEVDCKEFIFKNFDNFGVEMLRDELVLSLFPKHISIVMSDTTFTALQESDEYKLLNQYLNSPPSYSTVLRWVHGMGFKRDIAKNHMM